MPFVTETDELFEPTAGHPTTWVLLVAMEDGQARGELSIPPGMLTSGRPGEWRERVLITPTDFGTGPDVGVEPVVDDLPDTDFDVSWAK